MCVSSPSRSFLNWRIVSQLHPSPISPYPRLKMCISVQSRSHLNPIQVSRFVFPLHPGSHIYVSSLSQLNLTSIWLLIFTSRLHPGNISPPSRSTKLHLSSIQASAQTSTCFKMCVSPPSRPFVNWRIVYQLHPSPISPHPRLKMCISTHPGLEICVSSPPRLPDSRFFFVSVESYLNLGPDIYISPTSRLHLTSIQVHQIASSFYPSIMSNTYRFQ